MAHEMKVRSLTNTNRAAALANQITAGLFNRSMLVVPNCYWAGHEADLLVVTPCMRLVDVELKISRSDLKADINKDKWWKHQAWSRRHQPRSRNDWPPKVWKHYYAMPAQIWEQKLLESLPAVSGVILVHDQKLPQRPQFEILRRAKPNKEAPVLAPSNICDLARLTSIRYWSLRKEIA